MYKETDIVYENDRAWVLKDRKGNCYTVMTKNITHSITDSAYPLGDDGLSIAKARADYLNKIRSTGNKPQST